MKNNLVLLSWLACAGLASATPPELPERLAVGWLQGPDAQALMNACVAGVSAAKLEEMRKRPANNITTVAPRQGDRPYLLAMNDRFACVGRSGAGRPLLPPRFFTKLVRLVGATEASSQALYQSLASQLAARGGADVLIRFANGNAQDLTITVADDAPAELQYVSHFLKAGEFDEASYRFVLNDPGLRSINLVSQGKGPRRGIGILFDELAPRPLRGEHLRIAGDEQTAAATFVDSEWVFPDNGSSLRFLDGGTVQFESKAGATGGGQWTVEGGALYFNYGKTFGSARLIGDKLNVEFRMPAEGERAERRWTATLEARQAVTRRLAI